MQHGILIIDDEPDSAGPLLPEDFRVTVVSPAHLSKSHLADHRVILVDFRLDDWDTSKQPFACRPRDGLALVSVIASHLRHDAADQSPVVIALRTAALGLLAPGAHESPHSLLSVGLGLDWIFDKAEDGALATGLCALAVGVSRLPESWSDDVSLVPSLLGIADQAWAGLVWEDAVRCGVPHQDLARATKGRAVLRWVLQRVFPYPCCLIDVHHLAARLGVKLGWLKTEMARSGPLATQLAGAAYEGICANFDGQRWWQLGVEAILLAAHPDSVSSHAKLGDTLSSQYGADVIRNPDDYVQCMDPTLRRVLGAFPTGEAVRVQPDGWPAYAGEAWVRRDAVDDRLLSIVHPDDREVLGRTSG